MPDIKCCCSSFKFLFIFRHTPFIFCPCPSDLQYVTAQQHCSLFDHFLICTRHWAEDSDSGNGQHGPLLTIFRLVSSGPVRTPGCTFAFWQSACWWVKFYTNVTWACCSFSNIPTSHLNGYSLTSFLILFPAVAPKCMRNPWAGEEEGSSNTNTSGSTNKMEEPWAGLSERTLVAMVEQLFSHLLKVLNICAHVLDDTPPGPAVKVTIQSLWCF